MATYLFALPIKQGKTEDLKKYVQDMTGPRMAEYNRSCQKAGLTVEQRFIQHLPDGQDLLIMRWETDDKSRVFESRMNSNGSFDKWFRDKVITECLGVVNLEKAPQFNELISNFTMEPLGEKKHVEAGKK